MALRSGVTEERGDDYVGPALNRFARMLSVSAAASTAYTGNSRELLGAVAVRLFTECTETVSPDFWLTAIKARVVAQICQRLDDPASALAPNMVLDFFYQARSFVNQASIELDQDGACVHLFLVGASVHHAAAGDDRQAVIQPF